MGTRSSKSTPEVEIEIAIILQNKSKNNVATMERKALSPMSAVAMSPVNRLSMRPTGVVSKKPVFE